ncbi:hypothetical protein H6F90_02660 [Trichocoleus sp. FACHB-591]|uniref:hypothetical protein n=1 Tax=Trichocoleus sp. FACHB-591 TaxID=2692872 RepID=UPI0016832F6D|nr:hypothetical protein [Trichocoleus sp. FACHB-591]MBD2094056.1 hypothetical protein [Trichocoleus sp. FACHB-591]
MNIKQLVSKALKNASLVMALVGTVTVTAIVTRYDGVVELKLGPNGGVVRIDGRSSETKISAQTPAKEGHLSEIDAYK